MSQVCPTLLIMQHNRKPNSSRETRLSGLALLCLYCVEQAARCCRLDLPWKWSRAEIWAARIQIFKWVFHCVCFVFYQLWTCFFSFCVSSVRNQRTFLHGLPHYRYWVTCWTLARLTPSGTWVRKNTHGTCTFNCYATDYQLHTFLPRSICSIECMSEQRCECLCDCKQKLAENQLADRF